MSTSTVDELRQRLADYKRLRTMTWDAQALGAIDAIIAETEERLRHQVQSDLPQGDRAIADAASPGHR